MLRFDDARRVLELGVHDLIDAGPRRGDLRLQVAWSARVRMRAGQTAHTRWQDARRQVDEGFEAEVMLRHRMVVLGWEVTITGRVDGLSEEGGVVVVEEVKSTTFPVERLTETTAADFPAWARQVQLYLHFLASARESRPTVGRLVLVSLVDGAQQVLPVPSDPDVGDWIYAQLEHVITRHEARLAWTARRASKPVPFPHPQFRPGQEDLLSDVESALHENRRVLLSAPTGYGKTAAVLTAALRVAASTGRRVFFATARNTQQAMAEKTLREMAALGMPIRAVSIRARERACLNDVVACRPDVCRFAEGYHEKVRDGDLVEALWRRAVPGEGRGVPGADVVGIVGNDAVACPFALSMDMADEADVIVGDFNYVFDPAVRLSAVSEQPHDWIVIVDEAHNLPDRAMGYGSPEVRLAEVEAAVEAMSRGTHAGRYRPMRIVMEDLAMWLRAGLATVPADARDGTSASELVDDRRMREARELANALEKLALDYALLKLEAPLFRPDEPDLWMDVTRAMLRLRAALERAGDETVALWRRGKMKGGARRSVGGQLDLLTSPDVLGGAADPDAGLKLLCREPSKVLGPVFGDLSGSVCMSATLRPMEFYERMFGLVPERVLRLEASSPFPPEHRRVVVLPDVSTEYRRRDRDRAATAELVNDAVNCVPGNVAVFFPSFRFLEQVEPLLDFHGRPTLVQGRKMDEAARAQLLTTLQRGDGHVLLGVLGGIFSEGVDLPGRGLLAAVVVGPSLPQANMERRLLQQWYQEKYGSGFEYAWLVPGLSRVVQAAGRVIRSPSDRGAIVLIGRRFVLRDYAALLPSEWSPVRAESAAPALVGHWDAVDLG